MTAFLSPVVVKEHLKTGKLRALGVASSKRLQIIPTVPTLGEAGLAGVEASGWNGLFVPAGAPKPVIARLSAETAKILASPDGRYLVVRGRLWRASDPNLPASDRERLVALSMDARRQLRGEASARCVPQRRRTRHPPSGSIASGRPANDAGAPTDGVERPRVRRRNRLQPVGIRPGP